MDCIILCNIHILLCLDYFFFKITWLQSLGGGVWWWDFLEFLCFGIEKDVWKEGMKCSRKAGTIKDFWKLSKGGRRPRGVAGFWFSKWTFICFMKICFNDAGFFSPCVICQMYDFLIKDQAQLNFSPRLCSQRGGSSVAWGRFLLEPTSEIFKQFCLHIVFWNKYFFFNSDNVLQSTVYTSL